MRYCRGAVHRRGDGRGRVGGQRRHTHNVLLEGAAWNFINIRRTVAAQRMQSEAAYRFSRGVHPAMAERGVRRCLELMRQWAGGRGLARVWWITTRCRRVDPLVDSDAAGCAPLAGHPPERRRKSPASCARLEFKVADRRRAACMPRPPTTAWISAKG